jgi:hypothetical protein
MAKYTCCGHKVRALELYEGKCPHCGQVVEILY